MRKLLALLSLVASFLLPAGPGAGKEARAPLLVASIAPLHSLAAFVMKGVGSPALLLPATVSPHLYQLRPSDARLLARADVVLWVGPALESFLERPLARLAPKALRITALELPDIRLLPLRKPGAGDTGQPVPEHRPEVVDPHLWLDPGNARVIAGAVATALASMDAIHASVYRRNREELETRLSRLAREIESLLAPVRNRPFLVLHDAFQYFQTAFGLRAAGALTLSPEQQPGPRLLARIRRAITQQRITCIFTEPQLRSPLLDRLVEDTGVRVGTLDPIGVDLPPGPELYFEMMRRNARAIATCLS